MKERQSVDSAAEITEAQLKKIRARRQFKAIVRLVIANLYWLSAEPHLKSAKLHITQKRKGRCLLTISEKTILKTPPEFRTEDDIDLLYKVIGYLKCFKKYEEDIKRALVAHTTYEYFPPNRILVRQNAPSWAMYFILAGQLEIKITKFVLKLQEDVVVTLQYFGEGDVFGDSSLLHDTPRTATVKTLTHCELLVLYKVDFDKILKALTLERWKEVLNSVDMLPYFGNVDQFFRRDLCVLSQIVKFDRNDIILGDGIGRANAVHFIIKGTCKVIEHVPIKYVYQNGIRKEALFTLAEESECTQSLFGGKSFIDRFEEKSISFIKSAKTIQRLGASKSRHSTVDFSKKNVADGEKYDKIGSYKYESFAYPKNIKVHFMEICTLYAKSVFNVGECLERRRVVAASAVTCLRIPGYWLLPQSSVWDFIRDHLDRIIPDSEKVFRMYMADKKFRKFQKSYIESLVKKKKALCNTIHNVPYSIRMMEDYNFR